MPAIAQPNAPDPAALGALDAPWMFGSGAVADPDARSIVLDAFQNYESLRSVQETKWREADNLYYGVVPIRKWDGSDVVRAHISNNMALDQVEGSLAHIESALFDNPEWFSAEAMDDSDPLDARKAQAVLQYYLDLPDERTYTSAIAEIIHSIKSILTYGTGMMKVEWIDNKPKVRWVDIRNMYVAPTCPCPNIDTSVNLIEKIDITIEALNNLAKIDKRINLPSLPVLNLLGQSQMQTIGDSLRQYSSLARGTPINIPGDAWQPMPKNRNLELLAYYEPTRVIWLLNRMFPIFQMENPYGCYPFVSAPCRITHGAFYGMGLPEAIKYPQRYSEAFLNNHIDEMHLAMNPPKALKKDAAGRNHSDLHTRPGLALYVNDPKDVQWFNPPGATANVLGLIQYFETQAERRNGLSQMSLGGGARAGNINRTAKGIQAQSEGTNIRLKHIVQNIETYMLQPLLYKIRKLIRYHTHPDDVLIGAYPGRNGTRYEPVRAEVFHRDLRFVMRCASKMLTRDRLGALLEPTARYMLNGAVLEGLAKQGKKFNYQEFAQMTQDAGGLGKRYDLVVDMTPEEVKMAQQPPPQVIAAQQKAQMDNQGRSMQVQARLQSDREKNQTALQIAAMAHQPNPMEQQSKQQELQMRMQEMGARISAEQASAQMRIQAQQQEHQLSLAQRADEMQAKRIELQQQMQEAAANREQRMADHMMNMQMRRQQREEERQQNRADYAEANSQQIMKPQKPRLGE